MDSYGQLSPAPPVHRGGEPQAPPQHGRVLEGPISVQESLTRGLQIGTAALGSQNLETKPGNRPLLFIPPQEETRAQKVPIACLALGRKSSLSPRVSSSSC